MHVTFWSSGLGPFWNLGATYVASREGSVVVGRREHRGRLARRRRWERDSDCKEQISVTWSSYVNPVCSVTFACVDISMECLFYHVPDQKNSAETEGYKLVTIWLYSGWLTPKKQLLTMVFGALIGASRHFWTNLVTVSNRLWDGVQRCGRLLGSDECFVSTRWLRWKERKSCDRQADENDCDDDGRHDETDGRESAGRTNFEFVALWEELKIREIGWNSGKRRLESSWNQKGWKGRKWVD